MNTSSETQPQGILGRAKIMLAGQASADFAMVMSTGIVSVALHLLGSQASALWLFYLNCILFGILAVLYILRLFIYPEQTTASIEGHLSGPGYLTIVAGTCILGNQFLLIDKNPDTAIHLLYLGAALWPIIIWGIFFRIFISEKKPPIEHGINGAWLVATVSTQALVILGALLSEHLGWDKDVLFLTLSALFFLGIFLYIPIICMIFYRYCYKQLDPKDLSPTYWINAGAMAITTLAGSELILHVKESTLLLDLLPFLKGMTLMAWSFATWWIPLLILLGWWRHFYKKHPFSYSPEYWGMVFPLGMYTACTVMLSHALDAPFLMIIPKYALSIALGAWTLTFLGMLYSLFTSLRGDK